MDRRFHLVALIFFLTVGVYWYYSRDNAGAPATTSGAAESQQAPTLSKAEIQRQFETLEKEKKAALLKLNSEEAQNELRQQAANGTFDARRQLQVTLQPIWARLLSTNWDVYKKLRAEAVSSPKGTAMCKICDGRGKLDYCIVCKGNGKCATCGGTGRLSNGEFCPSCLGSGKCYLCGGTGKMTCPFCDDGTVYANLGLPPAMLPIDCQAPVESAPSIARNPKNTDTSVLPPDELARTQAPIDPAKFAPPPAISRLELLLLSLMALVMLFAVWQVVKYLNVRRIALINQARDAEEKAQRDKRIFEDPTMQNFFNELHIGMTASSTQIVPDAEAALKAMQNQVSGMDINLAEASQEFFDSAPATFIWLRTCLSEVSRRTDEKFRRGLLLEFSEEVRAPKIACLVPALRSYWLLSFALEGFTRQLSRKPSEVTASVLRTLEGALDMLEMLCVGGLRSDLACEPPIRLLAVDDNAVCLRSMLFALKKVFPEPDLAPEGKTALSLVEQHTYDVIFLDVEMPGMDGFEVCAKIRESKLNKTTPVVFVTRHSDFESRAKSMLVGAQDLIAKPYLPSEITVKTLMIVLRARLESDLAKTPATVAPQGTTAQAASEKAAPSSGQNPSGGLAAEENKQLENQSPSDSGKHEPLCETNASGTYS